MIESPCIYILTNAVHTVLYIGVTNDLSRRLFQHKEGKLDGFTKKYKTVKMVHYEIFERMTDAIIREKQLKHWNKKWKVELIEKSNPHWSDLYKNI